MLKKKDTDYHSLEDVFNYTRKISVLVLGSSKCGKTALLRRAFYKQFKHEYLSTIGVDFLRTFIRSDDNSINKLHVYDTSGDKNYSPIVYEYFERVDTFLFVFDPSSKESFAYISNLMFDVNTTLKQLNRPLHGVLIATKCETPLNDDYLPVSNEEIHTLSNAYGVPFVECSARTARNIMDPFELLCTLYIHGYTTGVTLNKKTKEPSQMPPKGCAGSCVIL
jgi:small GTP-binding protein